MVFDSRILSGILRCDLAGSRSSWQAKLHLQMPFSITSFHAIVHCISLLNGHDMKIDIVTMEELLQVKQEIVAEIKQALETRIDKTERRLWFRSAEVRKMLNISPGTLQSLRINGT